jgi:2,4-dienoyl-CoA reductase-like NADH-dependent reductase (Old Yellow Enzyme family)
MIFQNLKINNINLKNRIVVSPMCQYSSINGSPSKWHYEHLEYLSSTGTAMVLLESTAVDKQGKISDADMCLYNATQERNLKKLIKFLRSKNDIKYGIQISHSGRKGSSYEPWIKYNSPLPKKRSWKTLSASAISRDKGWPKPDEMTKSQIKKMIQKFKNTAIRANRINFDCLEIHMAHGYLLHQFLSPISNKRIDEYGGSFINRSRFLFEIAKEVRNVWPQRKILGARITGTDHLKGGLSVNDAIKLSKNLKKIGFDYVSVSSGGILPFTKMKQAEAFRVNMAKKIKKKSKIITTTSGMITKHNVSENIIKNKKIDFITIARIIVRNPRWIFQLAKKNKIKNYIPDQYKRII